MRIGDNANSDEYSETATRSNLELNKAEIADLIRCFLCFCTLSIKVAHPITQDLVKLLPKAHSPSQPQLQLQQNWQLRQGIYNRSSRLKVRSHKFLHLKSCGKQPFRLIPADSCESSSPKICVFERCLSEISIC